MNRKRECLQAYFAGLFDGEGSIGAYGGNGTFTLKATIAMDHPNGVALIKREYPEACFRKHLHSSTGKPYYVAAFNHYKSERFLTEMKPYLLVKDQQAKVGLSFLAHRRRDHSQSLGQNCNGRCLRFVGILKELKKVDPQGMNSVNTLLDHEMREYRAKRSDVELDIQIIRGLIEGVETSAEASTSQ